MGRRAEMSKFITIAEEVILKAMNGDEEAFSQIYNTYNKYIFFMAFQYYGNRDIAEDIVQEVFIKVHNKIDTLKNPKSFNSWMYAITFRTCNNYDRSKIKFVDIHADDKQIDDYPDTKGVDIISEIESERIKEEVMNILDNLSAPLKTVAVLRFFSEYKVNEIAEILDIPSDTVKSRLKKIRSVLKEELEKKGITKTYGFTIVTPALLFEAYNSLYEQFPLSETLADSMFQNIISSSGIAASTGTVGGTSIATKLVIGGLTASVLIGGGFLFWNQDTEPIVIQATAKISEITYDKAWQNTSIYLEVKTTSDDYDKITVNDSTSLRIVDNGTYTVRLIKDDKVIDEQVVEISNFDHQSPRATYEKRGNYYYLFITDDLSGIDATSIKFFVNGRQSYNFTFDESTGILIFEDDFKSAYELYISDNAGNILTITLK